LKIQRFTISALVAVSLYIVFTAISFFYYPTAYSPLTNWLSDLGNPLQNPSGAVYYKIGGVLTSSVLILFFAGMYSWRAKDKRTNFFVWASIVSGVLLAVSFMVTAIFPLGVATAIHSFFSIFRFVFTGFFEVFSACAIRRMPDHLRWLPPFGIALAMINFAVCVSFNFVNLYVGEWITVALFIGYILTLSVSKKATFGFQAK
jgi:hypothetical protein